MRSDAMSPILRHRRRTQPRTELPKTELAQTANDLRLRRHRSVSRRPPRRVRLQHSHSRIAAGPIQGTSRSDDSAQSLRIAAKCLCDVSRHLTFEHRFEHCGVAPPHAGAGRSGHLLVYRCGGAHVAWRRVGNRSRLAVERGDSLSRRESRIGRLRDWTLCMEGRMACASGDVMYFQGGRSHAQKR
jgi:hypothetical protein